MLGLLGDNAGPIIMSWLDVALLCGLFSSTFLAHVRLPILGVSAINLAWVFALLLVLRARTSIAPAWRAYWHLLRATGVVYAWVWVSSLNGELPSLSAATALRYVRYLIIGFSFLLLLHRRNALRPAQRTVYVILAGLAVVGSLEYWWPLPLVALRGEVSIYPRVSSLFGWPNQFGVLMAVGVALGTTLRHGGYIRPLHFRASLVPFLVALAFSGSRNGWFVLGVLLVVLATVRVIAIAPVAIISATFALILLTFPVTTAQLGLGKTSILPLLDFLEVERNDDVSLTTTPAQALVPRLQLWRGALEAIRQHPLTGIGLDAFANTICVALMGHNRFNAHNLFINVATELGLVGLGLFVFWLWVLFRSGDPRDWTTAVPLLGIGVGQLFDCFTYDYAFMTFSLFFIAAYARPRVSGDSHQAAALRLGMTPSTTHSRPGRLAGSISCEALSDPPYRIRCFIRADRGCRTRAMPTDRHTSCGTRNSG